MVRLWLVASALLTLILLLLFWETMGSAKLVGALVVPYLVFPWFLVVMVLGVEPMAGGRVEALIDGILSRPVTRQEYFLAAWAARVTVVVGSYLLVIVPAVTLIALANRRAPVENVGFYGIVASLAVVALVLTFQVSLAFLVGTVLRRPLLAIVVLLFVWYPVNGLLSTFNLQSLSPIVLNKAIPTLAQQTWRKSDRVAVTTIDLGLLSLVPSGDSFANAFGPREGGQKPAKSEFFGQKFDDFSLLRVLLGYGLPTLAAVGLATLSFSMRDL